MGPVPYSNNAASNPANPNWCEMGPEDTGTGENSSWFPLTLALSMHHSSLLIIPHTYVLTLYLNVLLTELHPVTKP